MVADKLDNDNFVIVDENETKSDVELITKLTAWLQPTKYHADSSEYQRHLSSRVSGTGLWLAKTDKYKQWHVSDDVGSIWLKGNPGAGKSVVAASFIHALQNEDPEIPVLFFFFRQIIAANHTSTALVRDFLSQLLPYSPPLQQSMKPLLATRIGDVSDRQLWDHLMAAMALANRVYCVVDALDEMDLGNATFLQRLDSLATFKPRSVKIVMTSRPKQYLQSALKSSSIVHVSLEQELVDQDIATFVQQRLQPALASIETKQLLHRTICERSQGLFLYARLITDQILHTLEKRSDIRAQELAETIPVGLSAMYNEMLAKAALLPNVGQPTQVLILKLVTLCARSLRLNEIAAALRFEKLSMADLAEVKSVIRVACAPLLEIQEDETVHVIHHSFTEFLFDGTRATSWSAQFPTIKHDSDDLGLLQVCFRYMSRHLEDSYPPDRIGNRQMDVVRQSSNKSAQPHSTLNLTEHDFVNRLLKFPFLDYAVKHWTHHARQSDESSSDSQDANIPDLHSCLCAFLDPRNRAFTAWIDLELKSGTEHGVSADNKLSFSPLHVAAYAGLKRNAIALLKNGADANAMDFFEQTPLHWAARNGHYGIVSQLLESGADPNVNDHQGLTPLHEAARKDNADIVKLLLDAGVNLSTPKTRENCNPVNGFGNFGTKGKTAIHYAAEAGLVDVLRVMIPFMSRDTADQAVCISAKHARGEAVQALLESGACSVDPTYNEESALCLCASALLQRSMRWLLDGGANPNRLSGDAKHVQKAPIEALLDARTAVADMQKQMLQELLDAGGDLERKDYKGDTPLRRFLRIETRRTSADTLRMLLECGADTETRYEDGDHILHKALRFQKDISFARLILAHGGRLDATGAQGESALHCAVGYVPSSHIRKQMRSIHDLADFLLKQGADVGAESDKGRTPLDLAVANYEWDINTVRLLVGAITDKEKLSRCLHHIWMSTEKAKPYIQCLLAHGADLDYRNDQGYPPIVTCIRNGWGSWEAMLECGANANAKDSQGRNALHWICNGSPRDAMLKRLIDAGVDPKEVNNAGNTILHYAVGSFCGCADDVGTIKYILSLGIPVDAENAKGQTAYNIYLGRERSNRNKRHRAGGHTSLLEVLQPGLNVNAQDEQGNAALHFAAARSEYHTDELLEAGALPGLLNKQGCNALHVACKAGQSNIVGLLVERTGGLLLDSVDEDGMTPLQYACASGRFGSVAYLLNAGASVKLGADKPLVLLSKSDDKRVRRQVDLTRLLSQKEDLREANKDFCIDSEARTKRAGPMAGLWISHIPQDDLDRELASGLAAAMQSHHTELVQVLAEALANRKVQNGLRDSLQGEVGSSLREALGEDDKVLNTLLKEPYTSADILKQPDKYLYLMTPALIERLATLGANLSLPIQYDRYPRRPLLQHIARWGLTELMEKLGHECKRYDDIEWVKSVMIVSRPNLTKHFQPILQAACTRELPNLSMISMLVERFGVDVNARHWIWEYTGRTDAEINKGITALHLLSRTKYFWQLEAIEYLVGRGADVNAKNEKGQTPLFLASGGNTWIGMEEQGHWTYRAVQLLLDLGADPNIRDDKGLSCLNRASSSPRIMQELLSRGADMSMRNSALFSAIKDENADVVEVLLANGADVDAVDGDQNCDIRGDVTGKKRFALLRVARAARSYDKPLLNNVSIIKTLLNRGANWRAALDEKETLLHNIFEHAEEEVVETFSSYPGIDLDARDQTGQTVFLAACKWTACPAGYGRRQQESRGTLPAMRLLDRGADITAVDGGGRNALHLFSSNLAQDEEHILQLIGRADCKPLLFQKDGAGFSPLHVALAHRRISVAEALVELGADLLERDPNGLNALHHLSHGLERSRVDKVDPSLNFSKGYVGLWRRYQELGGHIDDRSDTGDPALFTYLASDYAGRSTTCHVDNFGLFFQAADLFARNDGGETALHVVARKSKGPHNSPGARMHNAQLFGFLLGKGLDPLAEDGSGRSSLDVAAANGSKEVLELFKRER